MPHRDIGSFFYMASNLISTEAQVVAREGHSRVKVEKDRDRKKGKNNKGVG